MVNKQLTEQQAKGILHCARGVVDELAGVLILFFTVNSFLLYDEEFKYLADGEKTSFIFGLFMSILLGLIGLIETSMGLTKYLGNPVKSAKEIFSNINNITTTTDTTVSSSVVCPHCKQDTPSHAKHCQNCGKSISAPVNSIPIDSANTWQCPNCGKANQNYVGTCGCGQRKPN